MPTERAQALLKIGTRDFQSSPSLDVPTTQMSMLVLSVSAGVLFDRAFSL